MASWRRASTMNIDEASPAGQDEEAALDAGSASGYGTEKEVLHPRARLQRRATFAQGEQVFPNSHARWTINGDVPSMSTSSFIINLLADLSPAGILPLSSGMLYTGYAPSMMLLVVFACAAGYMMYLVSRSMEITGQSSYAKMWVQVVGPRTAWVPPFTIFCVCFGCCLAYACMFGDLFAGCMPGFGLSFATRTVCLIVLACFPLLPLCFMKDLSALAPTSFGALIAVLYTLAVMVVRYADESYKEKGRFYVKHEIDTANHTMTFGFGSLQLVNALSVAFLCHYNGCKYYREFIGHTPGRFRQVVGIAFSLVSCLFAVAMLFGYMTFNKLSESVILNNYSKDDLMINIARLAMGLANVFSFPLMFSGLREQAIELIVFFMPTRAATTEFVWFQNSLSTIMLVLVIVVAIIVTDASIVIGLVGSLCGSATIYVIPCILFYGCTDKSDLCDPRERILVKVIGFVGVFLMVAGAAVTLLTK